MELFALEPGLAIWTWISFGILFFILSRFALPPLMENLQRREDYIASAVEKTQAVEQRLGAIEREGEEILTKANGQADKILRETRKEAEALRARLIKEAQTQAEAIVREGKEQAEAERRAALSSLTDQLADMICNTSEQLVERAFVGEAERDFTKEMVERL